MSDRIDRAEERAKSEAREADLVSTRIFELRENPVKAAFDVDHLRRVHAYLFQDTPRHYPGEIRADTDMWSQQRALEGKPGTYEVAYLADGVEARIKAVLDDFGGPAALRGLSADDASAKLARLYGDLDHAHGFYEGNSRTLREFTRSLAAEAGFTLDWTGTNVTAEKRNALYVARDLEVITRHYPGVTPETAEDRRSYEAALQVESFRRTLGDHPLRDIIRAGLQPVQTRDVTRTAAPETAAQQYWETVAKKGQGNNPGASRDAALDQSQSCQATRGPRLR